MSRLGQCDSCREPNSLYIVGYTVICRKCGPKRDNPVTKEMMAATEPALDNKGKPLLNRDGQPSGLRKSREQPAPLPRIFQETPQSETERLKVELVAAQERIASLEAAQQAAQPEKKRKVV